MIANSFERNDNAARGSVEQHDSNFSLGNYSLSDMQKLNASSAKQPDSQKDVDIDFSKHDDIYGVVPVKQETLANIVKGIMEKGGGNSGQNQVKTRLN